MNGMLVLAIFFCSIACSSALIKCRDFKAKTLNPRRTLAREKIWYIKASLENDYLEITTSFKVDSRSHSVATRVNGSDITHFELDYLHDGIVAYYHQEHRAGYLIYYLFFNNDDGNRSYCYIKCFEKDPDRVEILRCYGTKNAKYSDILALIIQSEIDLDGMVVHDNGPEKVVVINV